jgi:putative drug exporter of the RND superfamily
MFERLGSLTYRFRFLIVLAWAAAAIWAVFFAPSLAAEGMTDQTAFLPAYAASAQANAALERAFPGSTSVSSTTLVFSRNEGLTPADHAYIADTVAWMTSDDAPQVLRDAIASVDTATSRPELASRLRSADGELEMVNVNLDIVMAGSGGDAVVSALREHLAEMPPALHGLVANVTGAGGIGSDYLAAIVSGTDSTTLVTILLVIVILLVIYRAPLAAMVPLVTIGAAFVVARGTLGVLALMGWRVSSLIDTFIVVLIFGVGTDYAIFLISRFREEVAKGDWHDAARTTVGRIGAVISASAATVMVGLGSMAVGDFGMIQTTGPALAIGIFVTLVAGLTLTPALLGIFGHYLFWPRHTAALGEGTGGGFFARLAGGVSRHPGSVAAVLLVALFIPTLFLPRMRTNFDVLAELPESSDARAGFDAVAAHLGRGEVFQGTGIIKGTASADLLEPTSLAPLLTLVQDVRAVDGVGSVTSLLTPEGDGQLPDGFRPSYQLGQMAGAFDTTDGAGTPADSQALLDPDVTDGLSTMATYLADLQAAYPDIANGPDMRAAMAAVAKAQDQVETARESAVVSTQLRSLARAMTSPTTAAAGGAASTSGSIGIVRDYLAELAAAYPEARTLAAFDDASTAVASLEKHVTVGAALDLAAALEGLATHFDDRPAATLFPESLAGTAAAKEARREIEKTFTELPASLHALAAVMAARPDDIFIPTNLGGDEGTQVADAVAAFISGDRTAMRFYVSTTDDPYSQEAFRTVGRVQDVLDAEAPGVAAGASAYLGGTTAQYSDIQKILASDFTKVGIITILGILLVLMLLLRAVVAPFYLVGTVLLSCATALGLSSWFFETVLGQPGVSFYLPILVFVLLVAIGSDYNIFLMSRVREESEGREIHDGIRIASGKTGAVITSAGLILAGTFAAMMTADLVILFQVGFAVALGVLIDTFLVRSILVPAITTLLGERAWWPSGSALARRGWPVVVTVPQPAGAPAGMSRRRLGVALAIVALVPVFVAGLLVWALADRTDDLSRVTAAVVNEDAGATVTTTAGTQRLALGADLAEEMTSRREPATFAWVATDAGAAADGLADGRYAAVLTIPSDFSATIASITTDGVGASKATLELQTNDATSYGLGTISRSVSAAIAASTSQTVTASYVDQVLVRVNGTQAGVVGAADRAGDVASRTTDLATGAADTSTVADGVVAGLEELADGVAAAGDGVGRLAAGTRTLASGAAKVADGAGSLAVGASAAANGAGSLAGGVQELADGLAALAAQTADLPSQVGALAAGADGVADGADGIEAGATSLSDGLAALAAGTTGLGAQAAALDNGAAGVDSGAASLAGGAGQAAAAASGVASGAQALAGSIGEYTGGVSALAAGCAALGGTDPLCAQLAALAAGGATLNGGAATLAGGAGQLATGTAGVAAGAAQLADGARALHAGTTQLAAQAPQLEGGIAQSAAGAASLATGAGQLADGSRELADGTATFAASVPALAGAIADAANGAATLAGGAGDVASGVAQLAKGTRGLASGAQATADGASQLADGTAAAADGASQLAGGMNKAADGARLVAAEVDGLAGDGRAVAGDASNLASGLRDDASTLPTYSEEQRAALGKVVADPVDVAASRLNPVATTAAGLAPSFIAISLWVGALAIFLVVPALLGRTDRRRWWRGALAGFGAGALIGIVQALLAVLILRLGLGVEVARLPELLLWAALAAVVFVAIVQAFVALFEYRGWLVALLLLVLQVAAAGVLVPAATAPGFLQVVNALMPLGYVIDVAQSLIAGATPALLPALAILAAWLVGSLLVTLAAAFRAETAGTAAAAGGAGTDDAELAGA